MTPRHGGSIRLLRRRFCNRVLFCQLKLDDSLTNDPILQPREHFYSDLGSGTRGLDPWGAGGLNARRDETGRELTCRF